MSLKSNICKEICSKIFDPIYDENSWRILVLDEYSTQIICRLLKMHDLFDKGITLVEDLNKKREPVPMEAIYLISSNAEKIQLLINDFVSIPTYRAVHVFFTDEISMENLNLIGQSMVANYVLTLKEININFLIEESQLFHFDFDLQENGFNSLNDLNDDNSWELARAMSSMCEILNENPSIFYQKYKSEKAQRLAIKIQQEMYKISIENVGLGHAIHKDRSILLILDRSFDPLTPLLHDLHLQCLAYDVLDINNNIYSYKNRETEKMSLVDLSENDSLWTQIRHMHIADVSRILPVKLKQLANAQKCIDNTLNLSDPVNNELNNDKSSNKDHVTKQLRLMMKKIPHLRQEAVSVSNMFNLSEACLSAFQAGVNQLCECEQNLVLGTDASGDSIKNSEKLVINVINNTMATMSEKIRLLLTFIISQSGIHHDKLIYLQQKLRIEERCNDIIKGIRKMGNFILPGENTDSKQNSKSFPFLISNRKNFLDSSSYTLSRWIPFIRDLISDTINGQVNPQLISKLDHPKINSEYLQPDTQFLSFPQRQSWANLSDFDSHVGPRLIIFIIGGVSLAESRIVYEITKLCTAMKTIHFSEQIKKTGNFSLENGGGRGWSWEVLIGGTSKLTPEKYLEFLSKTD